MRNDFQQIGVCQLWTSSFIWLTFFCQEYDFNEWFEVAGGGAGGNYPRPKHLYKTGHPTQRLRIFSNTKNWPKMNIPCDIIHTMPYKVGMRWGGQNVSLLMDSKKKHWAILFFFISPPSPATNISLDYRLLDFPAKPNLLREKKKICPAAHTFPSFASLSKSDCSSYLIFHFRSRMLD